MNNKSYPFRYPEELEKDITYLRSLEVHPDSKNNTIRIAIILAAGYVRKLRTRKTKKEGYEFRQEIEEKLSIKFSQW